MAAANTRASGSFVFTTYYNGTGFPDDYAVYVILLGMLSTLFAFSGYEAGGHLAEETVGSRKAAPRGIVMTCVVGAFTGLVYILGLLFAGPESVDQLIYGLAANATSDDSTTIDPTSLDNSTGTDNSTASDDSPTVGYALSNLFVYAIGNTGALGLLSIIAINVFFAGVSSTTVTSRITFAMVRDGAIPGSG